MNTFTSPAKAIYKSHFLHKYEIEKKKNISMNANTQLLGNKTSNLMRMSKTFFLTREPLCTVKNISSIPVVINHFEISYASVKASDMKK